MLFAAFIAWRLAKPLSEVSSAARQVAGGDLSARAKLPFGQRLWPWNRQNGEATRLLDDFNAMAASLERLEHERQATTAAIAHELRTPLAVLQARLAALGDGVFALDMGEIGLLAQQTDLLARLVEDLRNLSLADAGELELTFAPCDLAALTEDAVAGFEPRARAKGSQARGLRRSGTLAGRRSAAPPSHYELARQRAEVYAPSGLYQRRRKNGRGTRKLARPRYRPRVQRSGCGSSLRAVLSPGRAYFRFRFGVGGCKTVGRASRRADSGDKRPGGRRGVSGIAAPLSVAAERLVSHPAKPAILRPQDPIKTPHKSW